MNKAVQAWLFAASFFALFGAGVPTAFAQESDLPLNLVQLQLYLQKGSMLQAEEVVEYIEANYPKSADAHIARGNYEEQRGNWRRALTEYRTALGMQEGNEDYQQNIENVKRAHDAFVRADLSYRHEENGEDHWIKTLSGRGYINQNWAFAATVARDDFKVDTIQRSNGGLQTNLKTGRQIGSFTLERDQTGKNPLALTLNAADGVVGATASYTWRQSINNFTDLTTYYHRPTWDFIESQVDKGTQTGAMVQHNHQFTQRLRGNIGAGYNEYGIDGHDNVATTIDTLAGLRYFVYQKPTLTFDLGYGYIGQYVVRDRSIAPAGVAITPIGTTSTELHNADVTTTWQPTRNWRVDGTVGYSVNRLDSSGSFGSIAITHQFKKQYEAQLRFNTALSTDGQAQRQSTVGFYLQRRF